MKPSPTSVTDAAAGEPDSAARPSVYALDRERFERLLTLLDQPRYRAGQIWRGLYRRMAPDFGSMTDLPAALRQELDVRLRFDDLELIAETQSAESPASKLLFRLADGQAVETVLMHFLDEAAADEGDAAQADALADSVQDHETRTPAIPRGRHTVCLSTQAGCAMGCVFCATGQMGLVRDLSAAECIAQVMHCARQLQAVGERLSNVVFMGMGEPLANWEATWATVERLTDPDGLGMSPRRLTISTVGIVPGILRLAEADKPVRLAVSLHAPDDALRSELVAVNRTYGLDDILHACREYQRQGGRRSSFEYVLIRGVNDASAQARALAARLRGIRSHINLIPLNPTEGSDMQPSRYPVALAFEETLQQAGFGTTLRMRRGIDVQAGCGQLRTRLAPGRVGRTIPLEAH